MTNNNLNDCGPPFPPFKHEIEQSAGPCTPDNTQFQQCDGTIKSEFYNNSIDPLLETDGVFKKKGGGEPIYCDPMLTGRIVDDPHQKPWPLDKDVIYRYSQGIRHTDEAVTKLFQNIKVIDAFGKVFPVPLIWGSQERAVEVALSGNVRKDGTGVVDRITLPIMSLFTSGYDFTSERYLYHYAVDYKRIKNTTDQYGNRIGPVGGNPGVTQQERYDRDTVLGVSRGIPVNLSYRLTIWTKYWEDMNQILEQVATKFSPRAYIRVQGVTNWETTVKVDSVSNNIDTEPGDINNRVIKFEVNVTAESFVPQPIIRRKAVLKTKIDIVDSVDDNDIQNVLRTIETTIGELNI